MLVHVQESEREHAIRCGHLVSEAFGAGVLLLALLLIAGCTAPHQQTPVLVQKDPAAFTTYPDNFTTSPEHRETWNGTVYVGANGNGVRDGPHFSTVNGSAFLKVVVTPDLGSLRVKVTQENGNGTTQDGPGPLTLAFRYQGPIQVDVMAGREGASVDRHWEAELTWSP